MRPTCSVTLFLIGAIGLWTFIGCDSNWERPDEQNVNHQTESESKTLPANLKRLNGSMEAILINCIVGAPGGQSAAEYVISVINNTGTTLKNAHAHLFLLDDQTGDFIRLTYRVGTIAKDDYIYIPLEVNANTKIGQKWQENQKSLSTVSERLQYGFRPLTLAYISADEGTFEVEEGVIIYDYGKNRGSTPRPVGDKSIHDAFMKSGVEVPAK